MATRRKVSRRTPCISRLDDSGRGHGWEVQLKRGTRRYAKVFSDQKHGGTDSALRKAMTYRDRLIVRIPPATKIKRRNSANRTGVVGVALVHYTSKAGNRHERYSASWWTTEGRGGTSFSIARYGRAEAFRLAVEARRRALRERLGRYADLWLSPSRRSATPRR